MPRTCVIREEKSEELIRLEVDNHPSTDEPIRSKYLVITDTSGHDVVKIFYQHPVRWWEPRFHTRLGSTLAFFTTLLVSWALASCIFTYIIVTGPYITSTIVLYLSIPYFVSAIDFMVIFWGLIYFFDMYRVRKYLSIERKKEGYLLSPRSGYDVRVVKCEETLL